MCAIYSKSRFIICLTPLIILLVLESVFNKYGNLASTPCPANLKLENQDPRKLLKDPQASFLTKNFLKIT